jgi:hypothetical protein
MRVAYRPDRVLSLLNTLVSIAYYVLWVTAIVVVVAAPSAWLLAEGHSHWIWDLKVPAIVHGSEAPVVTGWGSARFVVQHVRGDLVLPLGQVPWWLFVALWAHALVGLGLLLLAFHHLRRIIQRVRDGEPFDAQNALRMRWLGLLFLGLTLFNSLAELVTSLAVRRGVVSSTISVAGGPHLDLGKVFIALVVVALAEVFRRGAELEREQSLVI